MSFKHFSACIFLAVTLEKDKTEEGKRKRRRKSRSEREEEGEEKGETEAPPSTRKHFSSKRPFHRPFKPKSVLNSRFPGEENPVMESG